MTVRRRQGLKLTDCQFFEYSRYAVPPHLPGADDAINSFASQHPKALRRNNLIISTL